MKEQIALLIALQALDSETVHLLGRKQTLPERIRELEEMQRRKQEAVDACGIALAELLKKRQDQEERLKRGAEGLKKAKQRLLDVKTNKEYQAILKEMESIESLQGKTEDDIISLLEQADRMRGDLKNGEEELSVSKKAFEEEKRGLENELQSLDVELARLEEQRRTLVAGLPADLVRRYETIRERRNGVAVISVWKEVCNGCHMNIPPQMYIELQRSQELRTCPNCHRIIYWQNEAAKGEP